MTWCARCGSERCCPNCGSTYDASDPKIEAVIEAARTYKAEWDGDSKDRDYTLGVARGRLFDYIEALDKAEAGDE